MCCLAADSGSTATDLLFLTLYNLELDLTIVKSWVK